MKEQGKFHTEFRRNRAESGRTFSCGKKKKNKRRRKSVEIERIGKIPG